MNSIKIKKGDLSVKKRIIALLLIVVMVASQLPMTVFAAPDPDYSMKLLGYEDIDNNALKMKLQLKGTSIAGEAATVAVNIKVDSSKLKLVRYANGADVTVGTSGYGTIGGGIHNLDAIVNGYVTGASIMGRQEDNYLYLGLQATFGETVTDWAADYGDTVEIRFVFVGDTTIDDLDASTVQITSVDKAYDLAQNQVAVIPAGDHDYQYGVTDRGTEDLELAKPIIEYPNSDVINLNGVKLDAANKYVNVPVSLPEAGADVTVTTTPTGYYTSDCEEGTEIETGVTYTYSLAMQDGSEVPNTVSIDTNGVLTVKAGAPETVVVITATGSYTNDRGNTSTAEGSYEISLRHGDAGEKNEEDPSDPPKDPGGEPDAEKTVSGVAIYENDNQVATSAVGAAAYEKAVALPETDSTTLTFKGKVVDQFGDEMAGEAGTWTVDSPATTGDPSFTDGVVTVSASAEKGDYRYNFTSGSYTATVVITVADNAITWPALTNDTITYGQTTDDLTFDETTGKVEGQGTITDVVFSWKADQTLTVTAPTAVMLCSYKLDGTDKTAEHNYTITVNKADQEIVTDVDDTLEGNVLQLPYGETVNLNTVVMNADVEGVTSDITATYQITDNDGNLITMTGDEITGAAVSADTNDMATLTITAAGDDNYNATSRQIQVYVTKPLLRATITFDTENPVYGRVITATITEADGQTGSLTADVDYTWGHVGAGEGDAQFTPITTGNSEGKLTAAVDGKTTVTYTPVKEDINKTLALKITTPTDVAGYGYIHSVKADMANLVVKASQAVGSWSAAATTNTITVDAIEGAEYAITDHVATALLADDAEETTPELTWQDSNEFTELTPNKEYDVYVRMKASDTHDASAEDVKVIKTEAISIDPENPSTDPAVVFTTEPSVTITGDAKYGETLTANLTDAEITIDGTAVTGPFYTEYQWYRTTPVEGEETEAVAEPITDATAATYELTQEDIGKIITVKVTPAADSPYSGVVSDDTAEVTKADGPSLTTDGFASTPVSNATATDGTLTIADPADLTLTYEYRLKVTEGEENEWIEATIADGVLAADLGVGTYEIRVKETDTTNASNTIEVTVSTAGYNITGVVVSYNQKLPVTYKLYRQVDGGYNETADYEGTAIEASETTAFNQQSQAFTIEGIVDGTYKLEIIKKVHITITIEGLVVNGSDVDLTSESLPEAVRVLTMAVGDIDENGAVNVSDANLIARPSNYNNQDVSTAEHPHADIDGNGAINVSDKNILARPENYNKTADDFVIKIS